MSWSSPTLAIKRGRGGTTAEQALFVGVLAVLLATGWVASHFVALMPLISDRQHLGAATLDAIFGIYAVGLLPGLLIGGRASDAVGRRPVVWIGSAIALMGTLVMLFSLQSDALLVGRLIVGFAIGPFASGVIAAAGQAGVRVSFEIAAAIVVVAIMIAVVAAQGADETAPATAHDLEQSTPTRQGGAWALSWAMPLAPWVFASATIGFITIPARMHVGLAASLAVGTATLIVNGVSGLIQLVARARDWGPQAGTVGAVLAALGYAGTAAAPPTMPLALGLPLLIVLGCASGLCLREGLIDLEAAAPQRVRGALTGAFYTVSYIGFGLPLLLTVAGSTAASAIILAVMAVLASATAVSRTVRLRRDSHR